MFYEHDTINSSNGSVPESHKASLEINEDQPENQTNTSVLVSDSEDEIQQASSSQQNRGAQTSPQAAR